MLDTSAARLHLVPRYRQKLAVPPPETGRPLWVDDPSFNLEYHVRHTALPEPGLRGAAPAAGGAHLLPAARPLQAAVGGVDGRGPRGRALRADHQDPPRADRRDRGRRHRPGAVRPRARARRGARTPTRRGRRRASRRARRCSPSGTLDLLRAGVRTAAARGVGRHAPRGRRCAQAREAVEGLGEVAWAGLNPAPPTPLNVEIGPHRRFGVVRNELDDFKAVKNALRRDGQRRRADRRQRARCATWLQLARRAHRGRSSCARSCPVSIRAPATSAARSATGSPPCAARCRSTSRTRSRACASSRQAMDGLKESKQAVGAEVLAERAELRAADDPRAGLAPELLHAPVQPDRDERPRPAVPALRARARAARTSSRSPSCPRTTRWRSRSCPTTGA